MDADTQFQDAYSNVIGNSTPGKSSDHAAHGAIALEDIGVSMSSTFDGFKGQSTISGSWFCSANESWP